MKKISLRRFWVMVVGNLVLGVGIGMFKLSQMGNDPHSAMVMAIGAKLGLPFSVMTMIVNCFWFAVEFALGRRYIGVGTFFNWACVGAAADVFVGLVLKRTAIPEEFVLRLPVMAAGVLVVSLGASLYQTADLGIAPYDSLSMILKDRTPLPYFWCRMITDAVCAVAAFALGGLIGLGTLCCAFGLGPFISFFDVRISRKLCGIRTESTNRT